MEPEEFLAAHRRWNNDYRFTEQELCDFVLGAGHTSTQRRALVSHLLALGVIRRTASGLWGVLLRNGGQFNDAIRAIQAGKPLAPVPPTTL